MARSCLIGCFCCHPGGCVVGSQAGCSEGCLFLSPSSPSLLSLPPLSFPVPLTSSCLSPHPLLSLPSLSLLSFSLSLSFFPPVLPNPPFFPPVPLPFFPPLVPPSPQLDEQTIHGGVLRRMPRKSCFTQVKRLKNYLENNDPDSGRPSQ